MAGNPPFITLTKCLKQTIKDWMTLIRALRDSPTSVKLLVADLPNILQYTDACGLGAGGVIVPGMDDTTHYVWQFEWPIDIQ